MTNEQKRVIMSMVTRMLMSFNLSKEAYLEKKEEIYKCLYGKKEKRND